MLDLAASRAREVAAEQGLEHEREREFLLARDFLLEDVSADLRSL
jgi:hypothetical protein